MRHAKRTLAASGKHSKHEVAVSINRNPQHFRGFRWAALLALLLLMLWLFNAPGQLLRLVTQRELASNRPHTALRWLEFAEMLEGWTPWDCRRHNSGLRLLAYLRLNQNGKMLRLLNTVAAGDTHQTHWEPYRQLAAAQQGDLAAANWLLRAGDVHLPPQSVYEAAVRCQQFNDRFDWARKLLDGWEADFPQDAVQYYQRGRVAELEGKSEQAMQHYATSLKLQPGLGRANYRLGLLQQETADYQAAIHSFSKLATGPYHAIGQIELADCHWQLRNNDQAWQEIGEVLAIHPAELVDLYFEVERYMEDDQAALVAAKIAEAQGRLEPAVELFQRAFRYNPRTAQGQHCVIRLLKQLGRDGEAQLWQQRQEKLLVMRRQCTDLRSQLQEQADPLAARLQLAELYFQCESLADAGLQLQQAFSDGAANRADLQTRIQTLAAGLANERRRMLEVEPPQGLP